MDAIAIAIATQLTISSAISKNCNCQQSIATAIKLLRPLLAVLHFSNISQSIVDFRRDYHLFLVEFNGIKDTCTRIYTWCVRIHENSYEVTFPIFAAELGEMYRRNKIWSSFYSTKSFSAVPPLLINFDTLPLLATDRFMMRLKSRGPFISDVEDDIHILAVGYTYGSATEELKNKSVIIEKDFYIMPTVEVGYIASLCTIVLTACFILALDEVGSRSR